MKGKRHIVIFLVAAALGANLLVPTKKAQAFIPVIDIVQNTIKTSLNIAAHVVARQIVSNLVQSTVTWANNGFDGNPVYVQNPKQFLLSSANQTASSFISQVGNGKLGFLCSPFQKQIQLSLIAYYYQPENQVLQCTWSGIGGNLQNFLSDFNQGGWDGWFSMTQQPTNNIYGAGITAQLQLSKQLQEAVGAKQQEYSKNAGFLDILGKCIANNPDKSTMDKIASGDIDRSKYEYINDNTDPEEVAVDQNDGIILIDTTKAPGDCIFHDPTETPGTVVQSELEKSLGAQTDQLVNAHDFDEVVGALINGLIKRVFSSGAGNGIFTSHPTQGIATGFEPPAITYTPPNDTSDSSKYSCSATPSVVGVNEATNWSTNATSTNLSFSWTGDLITSTQPSVLISYTSPGKYSASVTITDPSGSSSIIDCGTVTVTPTPPPTVTCSPEVASADANSSVTWTANVTGGSGDLNSVVWQDTSSNSHGESFSNSSISGDSAQADITYTSDGVHTASVTVQDANPVFPPVSAACSGSVTIGSKLVSQ